MSRNLRVFIGDREVGTFSQDQSGRQSFVYLESHLASEDALPLSLSLPLRAEVFGDASTRAFFSGLLPDDELRRRLGQFLGVSANNEFAMLAEVGRECAGAISIVPEDEDWPETSSGRLEVLDDARLVEILDELPRRPLGVGEELRLSLAGAHDKMAVRLVDGKVALPLGGLASTHILKTPIAGYEQTVANEYFCMRLAGALGVPVATVSTRRVGANDVLLVERYDRECDAEGGIHRVHQEDICQALGFRPTLKYQAEGGPSLPQIFDLLTEQALQPGVDRLSLLRWAVFNLLIGNADAHGKNVSVLHLRGGIKLAPFYDLMCTLVYPALSEKMAMKIGSQYRFDRVENRHLQSLAHDCGLAPAQVRRLCREMLGDIPRALETVRTAEDSSEAEVIPKIVEGLHQRAERLDQQL